MVYREVESSILGKCTVDVYLITRIAIHSIYKERVKWDVLFVPHPVTGHPLTPVLWGVKGYVCEGVSVL